ncbi:methyltransferase domain-containing protein [Planktomarina temperata]|nr:methyltransferase domain-containing protein [Planktomarina temperata]
MANGGFVYAPKRGVWYFGLGSNITKSFNKWVLNFNPIFGFSNENFARKLRKIELEALNIGDQTLLEMGSGNGFVSSILAAKGINVTATDISSRYPSYFPVFETDLSKEYSFSENTFDILFSFHVLEHIDPPDALTLLSQRLAISKHVHVVPTSFCMFLTLMNYPLSILYRVLRTYRKMKFILNSSDHSIKVIGLIRVVFDLFDPRTLIPRGHGNYSVISAIVYWTPSRWRSFGQKYIIGEAETIPTKIAYSLHKIFGMTGMKMRKKIGCYFSSSLILKVSRDNQNSNFSGDKKK